MTRRTLHLGPTLVACLAAWPVGVAAQNGVAFSTVKGEPSAATRVSQVLEVAAKSSGWDFLAVDCSALAGRAQSLSDLLIVTTSGCLKELSQVGLDSVTVTANIGTPVYCYALENNPSPFGGMIVRIAILKSAKSKFEHPLRQAFQAAGVGAPEIDADSYDYKNLRDKLTAPPSERADVFCVVDDGTGTPSTEVQAGPQKLKPVLPPAPARSDAFTFIREPQVKSPWNSPPHLGSVIAFPIADSGVSRTPPTLRARLIEKAREIEKGIPGAVLEAREVDGKPGDGSPVGAKRGVTPILVTKGRVPAPLLATMKRALLAAPVEAMINPCQSEQQDMYRSFVRAAFGEATSDAAQAALWEHATLLRSRSDADPYYRHQKQHVDRVFTGLSTSAPDEIAETTVKQKLDAMTRDFEGRYEGLRCPAPKRMYFFQPGRSAYYQYGITKLREALRAPSVNTGSEEFNLAGACLRLAFLDADGRRPTCGDRMNGMWTTYYAPFIAWAVMETEKAASAGGQK